MFAVYHCDPTESSGRRRASVLRVPADCDNVNVIKIWRKSTGSYTLCGLSMGVQSALV